MKHFPDKPLRTSSALRGLSNRYGYVICGSDQVWNPDITGSDAGFFLDFCGEDTRRISYAPSFGTTAFTKEFDEIIAKELRKFSALSVREKQGQEKVRELTGRIPELVLDPTFLLSADDWSKLASPMNVCSPYILYYPVIRNDKTKRFCQSLSEKKGLDILMIGGSFISANKRHDHGMRHIHDIDPRQWLYLFLNAEYIVTDSFHGLAFSVIFRKKVFPALVSNTNSRLEHLISMLGLEGQVIRDGGTISDPDYTIADRLLPKMQEHSVEFLKKALNTDVI